jgi:N-acyl-D-amino-acid deacylase
LRGSLSTKHRSSQARRLGGALASPCAAALAPALLALGIVSTPVKAQYDLILRGGRVLDGAGNPWRYADVGIVGTTIRRVGDLGEVQATRVIDVTGLYVAPGFIDVHSHSAEGLVTRELSEGRPLEAQGITTVIVNPDGGGPTDLRAQRASLLRDGLGVNVAQLVPHGSVRQAVLGMEDRQPTDRELDTMRDLVRDGMEAGAFGLSSGLYYAPGSYAKIEEVIALARVAAEYGGVYTSHVRDEADYNIGVVAALAEVIRVSREAGLPGVHTHIKVLGPRVWGESAELVRMIDAARDEGVEVYADQYPYTASGTGIIGALIPRWALVGGEGAFLERLASPVQWPNMRADIEENFDRRGGASKLSIRRYPPDPSIEGRTLQDIADQRHMAPVDLVRDLVRVDDAGLVSFNMTEEDVANLMRPDWTMTSSDGGLVPMGQGVPHPRNYGTFPRKIHKYVVEDGVVSLPHAIRSMTSLPAGVFGMPDRGVIRAGATADIVVFDLDAFRDVATYERPHQLSEGVQYLLVNGELAIDRGRFTGKMAGKVLDRDAVRSMR